MKNNFKTSKCAIIAILTFCLLFCISGTQVFAAMVEGATVTIEENIVAAENTTPELVPMMARGCGYNLPDDFLNGGRWTDNYETVESHLIQYHGATAISLSTNLHSMKSFYGLPANYNCIFDMSGGVYNQFGEYLGNLLNW